MSTGNYVKEGRVYCKHDHIPRSCGLCDLEKELSNLKWLAQSMCLDLIKADHPKADAYSLAMNPFDYIDGEKPIHDPKPFDKKKVKKYWILALYGAGKTVDEIQELTKSPRDYIQGVLRRTAKYRLEMEYKK